MANFNNDYYEMLQKDWGITLKSMQTDYEKVINECNDQPSNSQKYENPINEDMLI